MKRFLAILATLVLSVASFIIPLSQVSAASYGGDGSKLFKIGIDQNSDKVTEIVVSGGDTTDEYSFDSGFDNFDNNDFHYETNGNWHVAITADWEESLEGKSVGASFNGDSNTNRSNYSTSTEGTTFTVSFDFDAASYQTATEHNRISVQLYVSNGGAPDPGDQGPRHVFNGNAWFIWNCDGGLCRYKITGLTEAYHDEETDDVTYETKYVKASDVKDVNDNTKTLNLNALLEKEAQTQGDALAPYLFVYDDCILDENDDPIATTCIDGIDEVATWAGLDAWIDSNIDDYDAWQNFAIDPTGASDGANIISTNGDRQFRATIYDETDYYGISNAASTADFTYYPAFWDTGMYNPAYDISGTTVDNPKIIKSFLLEPQVLLTSDDVSSPITNITVASQGVPTGAVTITQPTPGMFKLQFNSNYYDKVVFRVTSGSKTYYVAIARVVVDHDWDRNPILYVPETDNNDYDMIATYYWADGTEKTFVLEQLGAGMGGKNLAIKGYGFKEEDQGKVNLRPDIANPVIGVSYTVTKSGSTAKTYKGTLGGSNKGTYFKVNQGSFIFDITK